MSEPELLTLLHKAQIVGIEIAGTASFFVALVQVLSKHLKLPEAISQLVSLVKKLSELRTTRQKLRALSEPSPIVRLRTDRRETEFRSVVPASDKLRTAKRKSKSPSPGSIARRKSNVLSKASPANLVIKQSRNDTTPRDDDTLFDL